MQPVAKSEKEFWRWFSDNEEYLFLFEENKDSILELLVENLKAVDSCLVCEVSKVIDGKREFVISAGGSKEHFPSVTKLVEFSPVLERWKITPFRPRMDNYLRLILQYGGRDFNPTLIWFDSRSEGRNFDLRLYHQEYTDELRTLFINGSYVLLDMILGEFDVTTRIRYIDHEKLPELPQEEGLKKLSELRRVFDEHKKRM